MITTSMNYIDTYSSDIFTQSGCLNSEQVLLGFLRHVLETMNYTPHDRGKFVYAKDGRKVYLALVDDVERLKDDYSLSIFEMFGPDDIIITDNTIHVPVQAKVFQLPNSWFGIYSYSTKSDYTQPDKKYSFSVRRLDTTRMLLMLEILFRLHDLHEGLVNFDCASHDQNEDNNMRLENWKNTWTTVLDQEHEKYKNVYTELCKQMPLRNHDSEIDETLYRCLLNMVIETYSSDYCCAFSEKIFRALQTPRLWTLFGGRYSVQVLKQMGFDVLDDIVDHLHYDTLSRKEDKITEFVFVSNPNCNNHEWEHVQQRCKQAADHNSKLLKEMKQQWPSDFAKWLPLVVQALEVPTAPID